MNLLKLPSMVTFQMDKSLQEKRFLQNQSDLNEYIKINHKNNNYYNEAQQLTGLSTANLPEASRIKFNDSGVDSKIQGKMLQDQMRLRHLESEYDLEKSKYQDQHNAKTFRKKYPYGKENVKVTQDVIERYRGNNYLDQSQMLKKFQQQAKQRKQQQKSSRRLQLSINTSPDKSFIKPKVYHRSSKKRTSILQREMNRLYEVKQKYITEVQKSSMSRQKENKKLDNIENILKDMKNKLDQNITTMTARQQQRQRVLRFDKWVNISRDRLQKLSQLGRQQECYRKKIPIVIYSQEKNSKNNYFSKVVCPDIESYERKSNIVKPEEFREVVKIYRLNKRRMDQLSEKIAIKENKSVY